MNGSAINGSALNAEVMPGQQKPVDQMISSVNSQISRFERYEIELARIDEVLIRIGMAINRKDHPMSVPQDKVDPGYNNQKEPTQGEAIKPDGILGRLYDIGQYADEIDSRLNKVLGRVINNLSYIEQHI